MADDKQSQGVDVGIKISQPYSDALTAADYELLFSSSWPSISVVYETTFDVSLTGGPDPFVNVDDVAHNLGFYAFCMAWLIVDGKSQRIFPDIGLNTNNIFAFSNIQNATAGKVHMVCFNIDLEKPVKYTYNKFDSTTQRPYDDSTGMRLVKEGKDIKSRDLRDYIVHSRGASPLVIEVATESINDTITASVPASYTPWAFGYVKGPSFPTPDFYVWAPVGGQAYPQTAIDQPAKGSVSIYLQPGDVGCLILLRDPFIASNTISVVY